jgi:hypothetical protein
VIKSGVYDCIEKFNLYKDLKNSRIFILALQHGNLRILKIVLEQFDGEDPLEGVENVNGANPEMVKYFLTKYKSIYEYYRLKEVLNILKFSSFSIFGCLLDIGCVKPYEFYIYKPSSVHMESLYRRGLITDLDLEKGLEEGRKIKEYTHMYFTSWSLPKSYINKKISIADNLDGIGIGSSFLRELDPQKLTRANREKVKEWLKPFRKQSDGSYK